mmetsp:Transcript_20779/g.35685  ORF Transcript_20779/g.35685 Transcript_20779/m.35685 type:complete len:228 (-) Transcript_20779:2347-3030(-)
MTCFFRPCMPPVNSSTTLTISLFLAISSKNGRLLSPGHCLMNLEHRSTAVADVLIALWTSSSDGFRITCGACSSTLTSKNGLSTNMKPWRLRVPTLFLTKFKDLVVVVRMALNIRRLKCSANLRISSWGTFALSPASSCACTMAETTSCVALCTSTFLTSMNSDCSLMWLSCSFTNWSSEKDSSSGRCTSSVREMTFRLLCIRLSMIPFTFCTSSSRRAIPMASLAR